jgi:hypothetical protein
MMNDMHLYDLDSDTLKCDKPTSSPSDSLCSEDMHGIENVDISFDSLSSELDDFFKSSDLKQTSCPKYIEFYDIDESESHGTKEIDDFSNFDEWFFDSIVNRSNVIHKKRVVFSDKLEEVYLYDKTHPPNCCKTSKVCQEGVVKKKLVKTSTRTKRKRSQDAEDVNDSHASKRNSKL